MERENTIPHEHKTSTSMQDRMEKANTIPHVHKTSTSMQKLKVERDHKAMLLEQHKGDFDRVRKKSKFTVNGKNNTRPLSFYHHMENVVATGLKEKKLGGEEGNKCRITKEVKMLSENGWPKKNIEELVQKALDIVKKRGKNSDSTGNFFCP